MEEAKNTVRAYSIFDIAKWQMELQENSADGKHEDCKELITLPTLQRGFVWKPYQMEALWDSILRGYPIGALLLSKSGNRKDLLDGQQRCTTIALGFQNPFEEEKKVLNLKNNIPAIWLDLQPLENNKYGLRFGVRVLTRSHPWGYQLVDHRRPIPTGQREKALEYMRTQCGDNNLSFTQLQLKHRMPWDAHFPIPLNMLLHADATTFEKWQIELKEQISSKLTDVETRHGRVDYSKLQEEWLKQAYDGVVFARDLLLPEIPVSSKVMTEDKETSESEENATLFVRLNAEGTRISGQELIYSMLKAVFPKAKELVEAIDLRFIAPSKLVNLFIRFVLIRQNGSPTYQQEVPLTAFRSHLKDDSFKTALIELIKKEEAKILTKRANTIFSEHPKGLPKIFIREMLSGTTDLLLVLLVYLSYNPQVDPLEEKAIRRSFLQVFLFDRKKDKVAAELFRLLAKNNFRDWQQCAKRVIEKKPEYILHLLPPKYFKTMLLEKVMPQCIEHQRHFINPDLIRPIIRDEEELRTKFVSQQLWGDLNEEEIKEREIDQAVSYWIDLSKCLFWNKHLLVICQREYFNQEFIEFMEFEGIEDTNRPWDWDHIYPDSWVRKKHHVSDLVRMLVSVNGNFRALSFNTNRSESNRQSPGTRFQGDGMEEQAYRKSSFIEESDLAHWLELTDADKKLKHENKEKVDHFVKAVFNRVNNIYRDCYAVITETTDQP